ncbi:MAG TPA: hypothetical protein VEV38_09320 [Candidatus Eremiobacteraceae bacterium]|nr:hypothetical protein [Candidatus Eremiobacteraceae bacterium]
MAKGKRHHVDFVATKKVKEPTEVEFRTKAGKSVDFVAKKSVPEKVKVSFMARNKKK